MRTGKADADKYLGDGVTAVSNDKGPAALKVKVSEMPITFWK